MPELCSPARELRPFAQVLREDGFVVVVPELDGYALVDDGRESASASPDYRRWIADATAAFDRLAVTHDAVAICGVSVGAALALAIAAERPDQPAALSLLSTALVCDGWNAVRWRLLLPFAYYTPLGRLYRYRPTPPYGVKNAYVRAWLAERYSAAIPTPFLREADRLSRHVMRTLGRVRVPTLLIHAREDDVAGLGNVRLVRSRIGSTVVGEFIVENSYHRITLDNDRELAAVKTVQFINASHDDQTRRSS